MLNSSETDSWLPDHQLLADMKELRDYFERCYSYYAFNKNQFLIRYKGIQEEIQHSKGMNLADFAFKLASAVATFGDGHTFLKDLGDHVPSAAHLPFIIGMTKQPERKYVAYFWNTMNDLKSSNDPYKNDRLSGFYIAGYPFVVSIDGIDINEYRKTILNISVSGRDTLNDTIFARRHSNINIARKILGLPFNPNIVAVFENTKGKKISKTINLIDTELPNPPLPQNSSKILKDSNTTIGYLRISSLLAIDELALKFIPKEQVKDFFIINLLL